MAAVQTITVTAAGGTVSLDPALLPETIYLEMDGGSVTLAGNFSLETTSPVAEGTRINVLVGTGLDLNGNTFSVFGQSYTANQQASNTLWWYMFQVFAGPALWYFIAPYDFTSSNFLSGQALTAGSTALAKLASGTSAQIIVCNAGGVPAYVTASGDITFTNAGVAAIGAGVIVDADVNASAAITRTKLANGTADHVVINAAGTGAFSSEAQLANSRGGTGQDTSASTGFAKVAAGTWSVGSISETVQLQVSFEAAGGVNPSVGDFKIKMPYAGTVTEIYAYAVDAISATDNGTITPKNNGGTTMTSGVITFTASDPRGTAYTSTPSANNTFAAGDLLTFTTAKTTAGGIVQLSITVTRTS